MKGCLVYIFIIFLISFLLVLCLKDINDIEGFNAQKITMETIREESNPSLAGSMDDHPTIKDDTEFSIYTPDMYHNLLKNNKNFNEEKIPEKPLMEVNKLPNERFTEYYTYETILPPKDFIKTNLVRDIDSTIFKTNIKQDLSYNDEKIFGLDGINTDDCQGTWLPWDDSACSDSTDRCTLKKRVYKIIKNKSSKGRDCMHDGEIMKDGDTEIAYCFGSTDKDRCGLEENACECDLDDYDADECDIETSERYCICPRGYSLSDSGKCVDDIMLSNSNSNSNYNSNSNSSRDRRPYVEIHMH